MGIDTALGIYIVGCIALEPLQAVECHHCLLAVWPSCGLGPVSNGRGWELPKKTHDDNRSAMFVLPHATVLTEVTCEPEFPSSAGTRLWWWLVNKDEVDSSGQF